MQNFSQLVNTVQQNCHISDARYAGNYSLCVFLLKMREYYRWECNIPLSQQLVKDKVGNWMVAREKCWEEIENAAYSAVPLPHAAIDPFAATEINASLIPQGYVYSSGHGVFNKPHFFLGRLRSLRETAGCRIYIADREFARDLVAPPAMVMDHEIFIRQESLRRFLWEKIEEWQWKKLADTPMGRIMQRHAPVSDHESLLDTLVAQETETLILHELGEVEAGRRIGPGWHELLAAVDTRGEFVLRAIRDLAADCLITLPTLLRGTERDALHFFFANYTGMRRALFPELTHHYEHAVRNGDDAPLLQAIDDGARHWPQRARDLAQRFHNDGDGGVAAELENLCHCHNIQ